ncbi:hypothetical protein KJR58_08625 [Escherichia coli]|nr:hypothetical protein [Escherichia coli]
MKKVLLQNHPGSEKYSFNGWEIFNSCILNKSDAADDLIWLDQRGRRNIKKKKKKTKT